MNKTRNSGNYNTTDLLKRRLASYKGNGIFAQGNNTRAIMNKCPAGVSPRNQIVRDAVNNVLTNITRKNRTASQGRNTTPERKFIPAI